MVYQLGYSGNPSGKTAGIFSTQMLHKMASELMMMPYGELMALIHNKSRRAKLSTAQDMVLTRIQESARLDSEGRLNFAEVMDRLVGKPKQSIEQNVTLSLEQLVMGSFSEPGALSAPSEEPITIDVTPERATLTLEDLL